MIALEQRQILVADVDKACQAGARRDRACKEVGVSIRTLERWQEHGVLQGDGRPHAQRGQVAWALSEAERQEILRVCYSPRFVDLPPSQIVPILADEGSFIASESTFYRVLRQAKALQYRGRARKRVAREVTRHKACAPNQIWSWDITYLPSEVRGLFYYLYAVIDIFSRKIVAWEVHEREGGVEAAQLIAQASLREQLRGRPLVLHADNGAVQKASTLRVKLEALGITPSHGRPSVSDDNAHIESWFRTCKYIPHYPAQGFAGLDGARGWVSRFVQWYNTEHRHSAIGFVTPQMRHEGEDHRVFEQRRQVYAQAREKHPLRWRRGPRNWQHVEVVWLNPPPKSALAVQKKAA